MTYDKTGADIFLGNNLNKLRGKITDKDKKVVLYTDEN